MAALCAVWLLASSCSSGREEPTGSSSQAEVTVIPSALPTPEAPKESSTSPSVQFEPTATPTATAVLVPSPNNSAQDEPAAATPSVIGRDHTLVGVSVGATYDEVVAELGEPLERETFEWQGGLEASNLTYANVVFSIHYDGVSSIYATGAGACTDQQVCIGDSSSDVEQTYGAASSQPSENPDLSRHVVYPLDLAGYCGVSFGFGLDSFGVESLETINSYCVPD